MDFELLKRRALERLAHDDTNNPDVDPWREMFDAADAKDEAAVTNIIRMYPEYRFI